MKAAEKRAAEADRAKKYAEHVARRALMDLTHRVARCRDLDVGATRALLDAVEAGTVTLTNESVAREVEAYLATVRVHETCKAWVRENGYAPYDYRGRSTRLEPHLCECCAKPMGCTNPSGLHTYVEMTGEEARANNIYHGGLCYHVHLCTGCGHLHAVDSSD